ncbi:MAG: Fe-S cluster assembly ATPase SufC [Candidatus Bostrichicola ureolyticus]|nr:MAG: Fe-S cluster assembly ATPase SufC [Candidatus Bostrichicola ureolyticus]
MLIINDLHVLVGEKYILQGINLIINPGEIHIIMGPNGSGKSTLAYIIAGKNDYKIIKGSISFEGHNILKMSPEERAYLGIFLSFQYPVEIPGVSLYNFIKTAINALYKARNLNQISTSEILKKIHKTANDLGLDKDLLKRSVNEGFSGGEKKRNEIFQMTMLEPKLAILDETDSGLDIDAINIIYKGVNNLIKKNNSVLIITHYQRLLEYITPNYVHILYKGKIIKSGNKNLALEIEKKGFNWFFKNKIQ